MLIFKRLQNNKPAQSLIKGFRQEACICAGTERVKKGVYVFSIKATKRNQ